MLKLFLFAIIFGLATSLPVHEHKDLDLVDNSTVTFEAALNIPEFELLSNRSVVEEMMPRVEEMIMNSTEFKELKEVSKDEKEVLETKKENLQLENKLDVLALNITEEEKEFNDDQMEILKDVLVTKELEVKEALKEIEMAKIIESVEAKLNDTEEQIFLNAKENTTLEMEIETEEIPVEKRIKMITEQMNKTERAEFEEEEKKLVEMEKELKKNLSKEEEMQNKINKETVRTQKLMENIKLNEAKFTKLISHFNNNEQKIVNLAAEVKQLLENDISRNSTIVNLEETVEEAKRAVEELEEKRATLAGNSTNKRAIEETIEEAKRMEETVEEAKRAVENLDKEIIEQNETSNIRKVRETLDQVVLNFKQKENFTRRFVADSYCNKGEKFVYFKTHPTEINKYVECDPWGKGSVKVCPEGRFWDQFHEMCSVSAVFEHSKNMTLEFAELEKLEESFAGLNCNNSDYTCVNGGECVFLESQFKCDCGSFFTGEFCQHRIVNNSIFSELMTGKFNWAEFKAEVQEENGNETFTKAQLEQVKSMANNVTHQEALRYIELYQTEGEVAYNTFLNDLIELILQDIYPDAFHLAVFNASEHTLINVVRTLPSLTSYSRYSSLRYAEVFSMYQEVLEVVVKDMNSTWDNVKVQATDYIKLSSHIFNDTGIMEEIMEQSTSRNAGENIEENLMNEFNKTKEQTTEFNIKIEALRKHFIKKMIKTPKLINEKVEEVSCSQQPILVKVFDDIAVNSAEILNSLFSYGFWFVTDALAEHF